MTDLDLREAFAELHGERLHGFALLVTLGDRERAGRLTAETLEQGAVHVEELRHPERAAAWLRAQLLEASRGPAWGSRRPSDAERREALQALGVDDPTYAALAALDASGRAAIAAAVVEGLSPADVDEIVGGEERARRARRTYLTSYVAALRAGGDEPAVGTLVSHIRALAAPVLPHAE